jgi:ATP-dependent Lon protease
VNQPLVALAGETLWPGERRQLAVPSAIEARVALWLSPGQAVAVVAVVSPLELPAGAIGRWVTLAEVCAVEAEGAAAVRVALQGRTRARVVGLRSLPEAPSGVYLAELEPQNPADPADPAHAEAATRELLAGAHLIMAALEQGADPEVPRWRERVLATCLELARGLFPVEDLRDAAGQSPGTLLLDLGRRLAARTAGAHASCAMEKMVAELAARPDLPRLRRQQLTSSLFEIQRRLELFDAPAGSGEADGADDGDLLASLQRRLSRAGLPRAAREVARRELKLLRSMETKHHDYATYVSHLDLMARLAWHPPAEPPLDLRRVQAVLDRKHHGLDKVKRRIREHLAVRALGGTGSQAVLCLVGPPGTGKTTIARAIAEAMERPFVRVALGGVHDESEIRGHRMSFVAATAGRIIQAMAQAGSAAPVVLLDELDKIGIDRMRSPDAALLEVLDPEQNDQFRDNFLAVPYDLSHVLFIATANEASGIRPALYDRLEPIEIEGYSLGEKLTIVQTKLMARLAERHGLGAPLEIPEPLLAHCIEAYTREAGLRQLEQCLAAIHRARALRRLEQAVAPVAEEPVGEEELLATLGPPRHHLARAESLLPLGVATALSVSGDGGQILFVEVGRLPGPGQLKLTGRIGEVMSETADTVLGHLRLEAGRYGTHRRRLAADFHVHVPEAATLKEGPSAGIALFAAILSAATCRPIGADLAMTGEVTLHGRVLPVGGVRAKLLAAERAGIRRVLLPEANRADVPPGLALEPIFVSRLDQAVGVLFEDARPAATVAARRRKDAR